LIDEQVYARVASAEPEIRDLARIWPLCFLFELPAQANIVVAGAYRGRVMALLALLYPDYVNLVGFEPQLAARAAAIERFNASGIRAMVQPFGLGESDGTFDMGEYGDEYAGFVNLDPQRARMVGHTEHATGELREAVRAFDDAVGPNKIDLLLLNIEGYEWILLPHLIRAGLFSSGRIRRLVLQVHWGMGYDDRLAWIAAEIEKTHKRVYDAIPSWCLWQWSGVE